MKKGSSIFIEEELMKKVKRILKEKYGQSISAHLNKYFEEFVAHEEEIPGQL